LSEGETLEQNGDVSPQSHEPDTCNPNRSIQSNAPTDGTAVSDDEEPKQEEPAEPNDSKQANHSAPPCPKLRTSIVLKGTLPSPTNEPALTVSVPAPAETGPEHTTEPIQVPESSEEG
jgi:hypothetical protein